MSKILAIFATEYATGKIGISFSTVQSQESYDMGKKLSQPDFYTHIASLTPEQRKALWEKEDALYLTPEIIS